MRAKPVTFPHRWAVTALLAALLFAVIAVPAAPAEARVFVGFSSRHWHHPHRWHYRFIGPPVLFFGAPLYYPPPPPPVYVVPAPVYVPGPVSSEPLRVNPAGPPYRATNGLTCREYQTKVIVGGVARDAYGTACLQPDGQWRIVD